MGLSFHITVIQQKKKKRRSRRQAPEIQFPIPMDLVMDDILTRLPAKSLMRFKSVSKLWSSHITSRYFSDRFLAVPSRPRSRLYMFLRLPDPKDLTNYMNVILSLVPDATPSSFVVDHDHTIPHMGSNISQNLGGFMCYSFPNNQPQIFNPATRQLVTLPAPIITLRGRSFVSYSFGHDPVNDQYKVICSVGGGELIQEIRSEHWVFVLKPGGGSWKKVTPTPHRPYPSKGLCIDGVIYYVASTDTADCVIVSFHISSEVFKIIQVVPFSQLPGGVRLINYGGKLTLLFDTNFITKGMVKLWVLEDATNNEWSRKTLVLQPSQLHLLNNLRLLEVGGPNQNGKLFFIPLSDFISPYHILCYDLQSNDMRKIEINGIPDHLVSKDKRTRCVGLMFMDQSETVMHLET